MNRERAKELWPVIKAYADGEAVQYKIEESERWDTVPRHISIDMEFANENEYRIKPEPREFIVYVHEDRLVSTLPFFGESEQIKVREVLDESD